MRSLRDIDRKREHWIPFLWVRSVAICFAVYLAFTLVSLLIAHVAAVVSPDSGLAERIVRPVASGLEFIDLRWKVTLLVVAPFLLPIFRDLLPRLRRVGSVEFDAVPELVKQEPQEKPTRRKSGGKP